MADGGGMTLLEIYMLVGFLLAAYAVVANDSIQTLGTFLASNSHRPWWLLWLFASGVLLAVLCYGWMVNDGDVAYGRLEKFPVPVGGVSWIHAIPPLALLILTRFGVPVSTTFLVLTVFAVTGGQPGNLDAMLLKSGSGYVVAFVSALVLFGLVFGRVSRYFHRTKGAAIPTYWVFLQWASTGFLWSQWLIQDLANIFVYLPRELSPTWLAFSVVALIAMQGYIFYQFGGEIQKIVTTKTDTTDIRAATIIDLIYGIVLLIFKEWNEWPMSTTWVFLGILAGREFALSLYLADTTAKGTVRKVIADAAKALLGLVVSVVLAFGLPWLYDSVEKRVNAMTDPTTDPTDPYLWLEEVDSRRALEWVQERNRATEQTLVERPMTQQLRTRLLAALDSEDRIPYIGKLGDSYYNFWRDEAHPRGIWRRTSLAEYAKQEPRWETVLDLDELARQESENWVLSGFECRQPDYRRCLVQLSRGGADAVVTREFDMEKKTFVAAEDNGFILPEAKSSVSWAAPDSLFVATDFGPGSMTDSGYPRIVKLWRRGQPLAAATTIFEGESTDVSVSAHGDLAEGFELHTVRRGTDFYNNELFVRPANAMDAEFVHLDKPADALAITHRGRLFLELKADWPVAGRTYIAGSLLAIDLDAFLTGDRNLAVLFEPAEGTSLASYAPTRNHVLVNVLDNVTNRLAVATPTENGSWRQRPLLTRDGFRTVAAVPVDADEDDRYFLHSTDYLTPPTLSLGTVGEPLQALKQTPAYFDASGLEIDQHWAKSADGTRIPYFQVSRTERDGVQPTLLYGYGGFEVPLLPNYSVGAGLAWLDRGGVYVVANIRGGGEFGPAWHRAALRENRQRAYDDFVAIAEDLVQRGVTTSAQLGILGGSNGGLLMGNMLTMRPDLFGAVVAQVPLMDMRRYHELLAGASWMAEFGDPDDPDDWRYLQRYSPYHNLRENTDYPPLLVTTSTRDDRVHPGHARKMVAKMQEMDLDVTYYENIEGGHGGAADNAQTAFMWALVYEFLWSKLTADGKAEVGEA